MHITLQESKSLYKIPLYVYRATDRTRCCTKVLSNPVFFHIIYHEKWF